jgi:hypothetical protein
MIKLGIIYINHRENMYETWFNAADSPQIPILGICGESAALNQVIPYEPSLRYKHAHPVDHVSVKVEIKDYQCIKCCSTPPEVGALV